MHCPFTSEISVKRKHIISITVIRYYIRYYTLGPIYLSECFPKETVLNLGIVKYEFFIFMNSKRTRMFVL